MLQTLRRLTDSQKTSAAQHGLRGRPIPHTEECRDAAGRSSTSSGVGGWILKIGHTGQEQCASRSCTVRRRCGGARQLSRALSDNYLERLTHAAGVRFAVGFLQWMPSLGG